MASLHHPIENLNLDGGAIPGYINLSLVFGAAPQLYLLNFGFKTSDQSVDFAERVMAEVIDRKQFSI